MYCTRLAEYTGRKKSPKNRHLGTLARICRTVSSTIVKKLVKHQYVRYTTWQYGELRPTNGWDRFGSLGHPCKFQRVSCLGSVTARNFCSGHQPNFAALNRGRHLYSAGRPSRWALAHILVKHLYLQFFYWIYFTAVYYRIITKPIYGLVKINEDIVTKKS